MYEANSNPYTLVFGKKPNEIISRVMPESEVIQTLESDSPSQQAFMITGVRGVGKTVFVTDIASEMRKKDEWAVAELNPERDMLLSLAAKLSSYDTFARWFQLAGINLSFFGFGLEVKNSAPVTDIETAIERMLESLRNNGKKLLIIIDEVSDTPDMRAFASAFQILVRQDLPVFLLMTGLYENINELQNEKNLTFLYRTPKIELGALNIGAIANNYKINLNKNDDDALKMAKLTKGYSFAFQVLGYLTWKNNGDYKSVIPQYRQYLEDYVYEKIWSELSNTDKKIAYGISSCESGKIADIRNVLDISTNQFNPYRKRLMQKGLIDGSERGYVSFTLPFFKEYVTEVYSDRI